MAVGKARFSCLGQASIRSFLLVSLSLLSLEFSGCTATSPNSERSEQRQKKGGDRVVAVQTAIAQPSSLNPVGEYTGTTAPTQQVNVRARVEGQLLNLTVDVGDRVREGQAIGRIDDELLLAEVKEAQAELAALRSEVAQARAQVDNAQVLVEQAKVQYQQAQTENSRLQSLVKAGAISQQQADLAATAMKSAQQALRSAQQGVQTQRQAVVATQGRVSAQQAVVAQTEKQRSYALLQSPIAGVVLERTTEAGSLLRPGDEVLRLGDFRTVKIVVQVSELDLAQVRAGQKVKVRFDAFASQSFTGTVARISPTADPVARLLPVEVVLPNPNGQIGSGLLARVDFTSPASQRVVVQEEALAIAPDSETPTLFVIEKGKGDRARVAARAVKLGDRAQGRVEIRSGLAAGESFVVKSDAPLQDGQGVKLSILSETSDEKP